MWGISNLLKKTEAPDPSLDNIDKVRDTIKRHAVTVPAYKSQMDALLEAMNTLNDRMITCEKSKDASPKAKGDARKVANAAVEAVLAEFKKFEDMYIAQRPSMAGKWFDSEDGNITRISEKVSEATIVCTDAASNSRTFTPERKKSSRALLARLSATNLPVVNPPKPTPPTSPTTTTTTAAAAAAASTSTPAPPAAAPSSSSSSSSSAPKRRSSGSKTRRGSASKSSGTASKPAPAVPAPPKPSAPSKSPAPAAAPPKKAAPAVAPAPTPTAKPTPAPAPTPATPAAPKTAPAPKSKAKLRWEKAIATVRAKTRARLAFRSAVEVGKAAEEQGRKEYQVTLRKPLSAPKIVLWVDDEPTNNTDAINLLMATGISVICCGSTEDGLGLLRPNVLPVWRIFTDMHRRERLSESDRVDDTWSGLSFLRAARSMGVRQPIYVIAKNRCARSDVREVCEALGATGTYSFFYQFLESLKKSPDDHSFDAVYAEMARRKIPETRSPKAGDDPLPPWAQAVLYQWKAKQASRFAGATKAAFAIGKIAEDKGQ